jgi:hypothetical protein
VSNTVKERNLPLSGALFKALLAVTIFLSASTLLPSFNSGAISDCSDDWLSPSM